MKQITYKLLISLGAICLVSIAFCAIAWHVVLAEGRMPSESAAIAVRDDILTLIADVESQGDDAIKTRLLGAVQVRTPLHCQVFDDGLLLVFRRQFVEAYGYYYTLHESAPPEIAPFCTKVDRGVYRYYNPG